MSCGVGHRGGSDPALLWRWCRLTAVTPIRPLAWEPLSAADAALKSKKKKRKLSGCFPKRLYHFEIPASSGWERQELPILLALLRVSFSLYFNMSARLMSWCLLKVLICISLRTRGGEHLFMCLFLFHMFFFCKVFKSFTHFLIRLFSYY